MVVRRSWKWNSRWFPGFPGDFCTKFWVNFSQQPKPKFWWKERRRQKFSDFRDPKELMKIIPGGSHWNSRFSRFSRWGSEVPGEFQELQVQGFPGVKFLSLNKKFFKCILILRSKFNSAQSSPTPETSCQDFIQYLKSARVYHILSGRVVVLKILSSKRSTRFLYSFVTRTRNTKLWASVWQDWNVHGKTTLSHYVWASVSKM